MTILHGNWNEQNETFLVWGETWRRFAAEENYSTDEVQDHPFATEPEELLAEVRSLVTLQKVKETRSQVVSLPTYHKDTGEAIPQHSAANLSEALLSLQPWRVEAVSLSPLAAFELLQNLPLGEAIASESFVGTDLKFWSHIARWSLDLLARGKFLPQIYRTETGDAIARWQPLLDSQIDRDRLLQFSQQMPIVCRSYGKNKNEANLAAAIPLLRNFLASIIDAQVRNCIDIDGLPKQTTPISEWLQAASGNSSQIDVADEDIEPLENALETWSEPVASYLAGRNQFHTCFTLRPPENGTSQWQLDYGLQADDDPELIVDAQTVWNHPVEQLTYRNRTVDRPQETLLKGLGFASQLYPTIEASLQTATPETCPLDPIGAYEFLKSAAWRLQDSGLGVILPPGLTNLNGAGSRLGLSVRAEIPKKRSSVGLQGLLNFKWDLSLGGTAISREEFEHLITQGSPLVEVNGNWVELRPGEVRSAMQFFNKREGEMSLSLEDALRVSTGETTAIDKLPVVQFEAGKELEELMATLTGNKTVEAIAPPDKFRGQLRPYQARGAGWLAFLERWGMGACLADDMGLGKTVQAIAFWLSLQEKDALDAPILLVCPTSVLGNWQREIQRFGPSLKSMVYHGSDRPKGKDLLKAVGKHHILITSYSLVARDRKDLQKVNWRIVTLDEAQNIKNPTAKQSQAVRELNADFCMALTGTPVENRLSELWSIMDFLNPGYLGQREFFKKRFATPIEKYGDTDSLQTLRSLVQPFILRRLKTDRSIIQDLPEKQENIVFCSLTIEQAKHYEATVKAELDAIDSAEGIQRRGKILAMITKLKQICNHPELTKAKTKKVKSSDLGKQSGKLQRLREMLEEAVSEGDRALIFTQFAEWGKLLKSYLEQQFDRDIFFLYGATTRQKREEMVDRFQNDPQGPPIIILSLKAGGTGLNLTRANHVFHFDRWWNPAVENQATDRAFRIGQTKNVQVHKFVSTGTLEEKINDIIAQKTALAEQIVGTGEDWLTELDTEALRNLVLLDRDSIIEEED